MKTLLSLLVLLSGFPVFSAQPNYERNGWTTNVEAKLPFRVKSTNEVYFGDSSIYVFKRAINSYYYGTSAGQADDGTSSGSVGIGIQALTACSNGLGNVAIGANSLVSLTNDAGGLFSYGNTAVGLESGYTVLNGVNGIYIGRQSGTIAGGGTLGGVDNICIGYRAGFTDALTNTVTIGSESVASNDNTFVLGRGDMQDYVFRGQTYTFPPVRGTNEYLFIGDGGQLYWTNVVSFTTNISGDSFVTNLYVYSNFYSFSTNYLNTEYVTNLYVTSNAYFFETNFSSFAYTTNLFVTSNAYFFETNFFNYTYTTNLSFFESNVYVAKTLYVSNFFATNIENAPGPFVLLPHASTNGFPNALSLSNGTGITFSTNGQFLVLGATATGGGSTNGFMPLQIQSVSLPNTNYMLIDKATNFTWTLIASNGWYCYWASMIAPADYMSNTLSLWLSFWPRDTNAAFAAPGGTNQLSASIMCESNDGTTDGEVDSYDTPVVNTVVMPASLRFTTNTVIDLAGFTDGLQSGKPFHLKLTMAANPVHTNIMGFRGAQLRYVRQ